MSYERALALREDRKARPARAAEVLTDFHRWSRRRRRNVLRRIREYSRIDAPVIYQHPLAYLLGLEGIPGNPPNIWALHRFCTAATNAAYRENPAAIIWHFQLAGD